MKISEFLHKIAIFFLFAAKPGNIALSIATPGPAPRFIYCYPISQINDDLPFKENGRQVGWRRRKSLDKQSSTRNSSGPGKDERS